MDHKRVHEWQLKSQLRLDSFLCYHLAFRTPLKGLSEVKRRVLANWKLYLQREHENSGTL